MTAPELDTQTNPPRSPRTSVTKKIIKGFAIVGALVLILVLCVALLLTYWFPSELVRGELEVRLSDMLDGTVRIQELSFNLLTGLSLQHVEFIQQGPQPMLELDRLVLDYSLFGLLQQKLKINEVRIEGADLFLNVAELQAGADSSDVEPTPPPSEPTALPPIPLTLDLEALVISRTNIEVEVSPELDLMVRDLNLEVSGGVAHDVVQVKGALSVAQIGVDLEEEQLRFPLGLNFDMKADLPAQHLVVNHVTLTSEPTLGLTISGQVEQFLAAPSVDLSLSKTRFDIQRTLTLVNDFVPPEYRAVNVSGILSPTVSIKGAQGEKGFTGSAAASIVLQRFQANLAQFATSLRPTDVQVEVTDIAIKDNVPESASVGVHVQSEKALYEQYEVEDLNFQLSGDYFALGPVSAKMSVSGTATMPPQEPLAAMTLPFALQLDARGNYRTQDATIKHLVMKLGELLNVEIEGTVNPHAGPPRTMSVDLKTRLEPHIQNILPLVPQHLLEDLFIEKLAAQDFVIVDAQARLDREYRPIDVDLTARVNMGKMSIRQESLSAGGTLDTMNISLATEYNALKEDIRGSFTGRVNLADLDYQGQAAVGAVDLAVETSFSGTLSSAFDLSGMRSTQSVNLSAKGLRYASPALGLDLEELTMSAKLHEAIDDQHFTVDELRVTSEPLMDVQLAMDFQQATQDFDVSVDIPYLNVGELQRKVSGDATQSLNDVNPGGDLSLSLQASGRVPEEKEIQALDIPVALNTKLSLNNVHGGLADYQVKGAEGTVSFSFLPGEHPIVSVETDLSFAEVLLAPGLPLERLLGTFVQLNIMTKNFNEMNLNTFHVGMNGADVSVEGAIGGLREIIENKRDVMSVLPDMFAQLKTNVRVSLDEFQQVLEPKGLMGKGQAQVGLSFLKKERGLLALKLILGSRGIQLIQDGTQVKNVEGEIIIRKRLDWMDTRRARKSAQMFRPSDVLSQLRSVKGKEKSLSIDLLDIGFLSVSNFSANVLFDQDAFKIQNLAMNLLDGGLGGNIIVTGGKAFGVAGHFEAAHLDLNQLLDDKLKISGDSLVDATIGLSVFFEETTGALDLSRTDMTLFITHIGREAVDRLLVFLDPEGSNPTLVSARSQITLANPSEVSIELARGMLSLEILFSEGLIPPFRLNRIPIGKVKQFKTVTEGIPDWENIRALMAVIGARTYRLDEEGALVLQ